jgi:hypothetical protein
LEGGWARSRVSEAAKKRQLFWQVSRMLARSLRSRLRFFALDRFLKNKKIGPKGILLVKYFFNSIPRMIEGGDQI